jgi:hypothetical protein
VKLPDEISRPSKFSHAQTILYEIEMLRFTVGAFAEADKEPDERSSWRNLECFLLHFRNLIEFFGKPQPRKNDLNIRMPEKIWPDSATRPCADVLNPLQREDLWNKYEAQVEDKISRYLQHCTEQRVDAKNWRVREMFEELDPLMSEFEKLLPDTHRPWKISLNPSVSVMGMRHSCSTASPAQVSALSSGLKRI